MHVFIMNFVQVLMDMISPQIVWQITLSQHSPLWYEHCAYYTTSFLLYMHDIISCVSLDRPKSTWNIKDQLATISIYLFWN